MTYSVTITPISTYVSSIGRWMCRDMVQFSYPFTSAYDMVARMSVCVERDPGAFLLGDTRVSMNVGNLPSSSLCQ